MADKIPIIMVHNAECWPVYMLASVCQISRMNLETPFFVVSDLAELKNSGVTTLSYKEFEPVLKEFREVYIHMSPLAYEFERTCIERWFIIREIMRAKGLKRVFCTDSDVLLFNVIAQMANRFEGFDYTTHNEASWGTTFINRIEVLDDFCNLVLATYNRDSKVWPEAARRFGFDRPYHRMHVCDMSFVDLFKWAFKDKYKCGDASQIYQGSFIDPNFNCPEPGLEMDGRYKKIEWVEGFPYCRSVETGELIRADLLHFQGVMAKGLMKGIFDAFSPTYERLMGRVTG